MSRLTDLGNGNLQLTDAIICYPHLFEPKAVGRPGQTTGEPKFSAIFVVPALQQDEAAVYSKMFMEAVQRTWPNGDYPKDQNGAPAFQVDKNCFLLSHKLQESLGTKFPGALFVSAGAAQNRPPAIGIGGFRATPDQQSQIFGGCKVNAVVRIYCYKNQSMGITAALNGVALVDNVNVERLDGGIDAAAALGFSAGTPPGAPPPSAPAPNQPGPATPPQQQVQPGVAPAPGPMPGVQQAGAPLPWES